MHIQSYQIHNVLNVYRRQLSQAKTNPASAKPSEAPASYSVTISSKGNHKSVMEKVAQNVLKKITNIDPESGVGQVTPNQTKTVDKQLHLEAKDNQFVFNTIAENNQKETHSIAVDNSNGLMSRLDELAKAAITNKDEKNE